MLLVPTKVKQLLFVVALATSAASAQSARWVNIAPRGLLPLWIDTTTLTHSGRVYTVWPKFSYEKTQHLTVGKLSYSFKTCINLFDVDCETHKIKSRQVVYYNAAGEMVHSNREYGVEEFEVPIPESIGENVGRGV